MIDPRDAADRLVNWGRLGGGTRSGLAILGTERPVAADRDQPPRPGSAGPRGVPAIGWAAALLAIPTPPRSRVSTAHGSISGRPRI